MTGEIGYTHALFGGIGSNLRNLAEKYDQESEGGNNNGLLDGKEISLFSKELKEKTGCDFSSLGLVQSVEKTVKNEYDSMDANKTIAEKAADKYRAYNTNWKSIFTLNEGKLQKNEIKVSYLSDDDYKAGRKALDDSKVESLLAKAMNEEKNKNAEKSNYDPRDTFTKFISWIVRQFK